MEEERKLTKIISPLEGPRKEYQLKDQKLIEKMPKAIRSDSHKKRGPYSKKSKTRRMNNPDDDGMAKPNLINSNLWSNTENNPVDGILPLYPTSTDFTAESEFDPMWCDLSTCDDISAEEDELSLWKLNQMTHLDSIAMEFF